MKNSTSNKETVVTPLARRRSRGVPKAVNQVTEQESKDAKVEAKAALKESVVSPARVRYTKSEKSVAIDLKADVSEEPKKTKFLAEVGEMVAASDMVDDAATNALTTSEKIQIEIDDLKEQVNRLRDTCSGFSDRISLLEIRSAEIDPPATIEEPECDAVADFEELANDSTNSEFNGTEDLTVENNESNELKMEKEIMEEGIKEAALETQRKELADILGKLKYQTETLEANITVHEKADKVSAKACEYLRKDLAKVWPTFEDFDATAEDINND